MAALRGIETPEYVAVVGKPRTYEKDDGEKLVSLTPESVAIVEQATRNQWMVETAERTLERIAAMEDVEMGEESSADIERAVEAYGENLELSEYEANAKKALAGVAGIELTEDDEGTESQPRM